MYWRRQRGNISEPVQETRNHPIVKPNIKSAPKISCISIQSQENFSKKKALKQLYTTSKIIKDSWGHRPLVVFASMYKAVGSIPNITKYKIK